MTQAATKQEAVKDLKIGLFFGEKFVHEGKGWLFFKESRIDELLKNNVPAFKNKYVLMGNLFSDRLNNYIKKTSLQRWCTHISPYPYKKREDDLLKLHMRCDNAITRLDKGVYHIDWSEQICGHVDNNSFIAFVDEGEAWTEESIASFIVKFSRKLKDFQNKIRDEEIAEDNPFDSIFLPDKLIKEVRMDIEDFLSSRILYEKELKLPWKRGYMFLGPPGNGKTLLIRCLKDYYNLWYKDIKDAVKRDGSIHVDSIIEQGIEEIIFPSEHRPTLCVLEDIDKFAVYQGGTAEHRDEGTVTLHNLLKAIDGVVQVQGIIFVATTNYAGTISEALVNRPGRFDRIWEVKPPTTAEILKFLQYHKMEIKDVSLDKIATEFKDYNMAFVEEFVKSSKQRYKRSKFKYDEVKSIIDSLHRHNEMAKRHFEESKPQAGFAKE